jgi:hypothetical protein
MPHAPDPMPVDQIPDRFHPGTTTRVLEGYLGGVTDERVIFFPRLDHPYSIELRRADVIEFETGLPSGACRFVVPAAAPVQERITIRTVARRPNVAAEIGDRVADGDLDGWIHETCSA